MHYLDEETQKKYIQQSKKKYLSYEEVMSNLDNDLDSCSCNASDDCNYSEGCHYDNGDGCEDDGNIDIDNDSELLEVLDCMNTNFEEIAES